MFMYSASNILIEVMLKLHVEIASANPNLASTSWVEPVLTSVAVTPSVPPPLEGFMIGRMVVDILLLMMLFLSLKTR